MKKMFKKDAEEQLRCYFHRENNLIFPKHSKPEISIIVVTYTQTALELMCLQSIRQQVRGCSYELVISNNGFSEDNRKFLDSLQNVTVINHKENLGFVKGVNEGVKHARGDYIFLLNDDALLTEGSLESLFRMICPWEKTKIGVVGGKICTLDNKIQDAGGILWRDGAAAEYCKGRNPEVGAANFVREPNYVSGAAFMTPRKLFNELGGFDEDYSPGYGEESDYCCRVRKAGYKVVYEPRAKIVHYEYGSSNGSTEVDNLVKAHIKVLYNKNKGLLAKGRMSDACRALCRTTRHYKGHVLIITDHVPHSYFGEDSRKLCQFIEELDKKDFFVTLFPIHAGLNTWDTAYESLPRTVEVMLYENIEDLSKFLKNRKGFYDYVITRGFDIGDISQNTDYLDGRYIISLQSSESFDSAKTREILKPTLLWVDWHIPEYDSNAGDYAVYSYCNVFKSLGFKIRYWSDDPKWEEQDPRYEKTLVNEGWDIWNSSASFQNTLQDLGHTIDVVVLARPPAINYLEAVKKFTKAPIIYYCHDLHYLRETRRLTQSGEIKDPRVAMQLEQLKMIEHMIIKDSDLLVTVSQFEKEEINRDIPEARVSVWPWYCPPKMKELVYTTRPSIVFLGGLQHSPNLDAIRWFLEDVYPRVIEKLPETCFNIVGSYIPEEILKLDDGKSISVKGFCKDLSEVFSQSSLLVAPIRYGAGFKGKIAMAMSYGLPVVATSLGAEGMGLVSGKHLLVADTAQEFADAVLRLLTDESFNHLIAQNSLDYARDHWSADAVSRQLLLDIKEVS
jgi:GT2 family glycosyltransferase/glycosyltransferase involved in cell wall biosynthesis